MHCQMDQLEGLQEGWAYIECLVSDERGDKVMDAAMARSLCQQMRRKLTERLQSAKRRSHHHGNHRQHANRPSFLDRMRVGPGRAGSPADTPAASSGPAASGSLAGRVAEGLELEDRRPGSDPGAAPQQAGSPAGRDAAFALLLQGCGGRAAEKPSCSSSSASSGHAEAERPAGGSAASAEGEGSGCSSVRSRASSATAAEVMSQPLRVVSADISLPEALTVMTEMGSSCLLVDNGPAREPGLVTRRDFLAKGSAWRAFAVGDVQSRPIAAAARDDPIAAVASLMSSSKVKRVLVRDPLLAGHEDKTLQYVGEVTEDTVVGLALLPSRPREAPAGREGLPPPPSARPRKQDTVSRVLEGRADPWEIPFSEVSLISRIGQGSYGEVWHGRWRGTDVAVKRLWGLQGSLEEAASAARDFHREISLLARIRHPNVVMFLGACCAGPDVALVMEYCPRGTLHRLLHRSAGAVPPLPMRLRMAAHVARGMLALHSASPRIIHRDLKTANLLVGASFDVKVCDFGLSRTMEHAAASCSNRSQSAFGTVEYAAPEVLRGEPYSEKCDVWSFGVVLWEMLSAQRPFQGMHSVSIIAGVSLGRLSLPPLPEDVASGALRDLVERCCQQEAAARPSFVEILTLLEEEHPRPKASGRSDISKAAAASGDRWGGAAAGGAGVVTGAAPAQAPDLDSPFASMAERGEPS